MSASYAKVSEDPFPRGSLPLNSALFPTLSTKWTREGFRPWPEACAAPTRHRARIPMMNGAALCAADLPMLIVKLPAARSKILSFRT